MSLLDECLSRELIAKNIVRKFSTRARDYMQAYQAFETDEMKGGMRVDGKVLDVTYNMIEKTKKVVSCHCAALDHNKSYLDTIMIQE